MSRRRPTRRPWVSIIALTLLLTIGIISGWLSIAIGNWHADHRAPDAGLPFATGAVAGRATLIVIPRPQSIGIDLDHYADRPMAIDIGPLSANAEWRARASWSWRHTWFNAGPAAYGFALPMWWVAAPLLVWTAWRWWRFEPLAPGECLRCRYDAAGLDACPECGAPIAREQSHA